MENENQNEPVISAIPLPPAVQPKAKMKWWKKILIVLFFLGVLAALAWYNLPGVLNLCCSRDSKLEYDSDLKLVKVDVPDSENGFFDLNEIKAESVYDPPLEGRPSSQFSLSYTYYGNPTPEPWNQQLVDEILAKNQPALDLFSAAAQKKSFQIPSFADPSAVDRNSAFIAMNSWRQLSRLQAIRALSFSYQGKTDEALEAAVNISELGHKIVNSNTEPVGGLVGISMLNLGAQTILKILPYATISTTTLEGIAGRLQIASNNKTGYQNMYKFDYQYQISDLPAQMKEALDSALADAKDEKTKKVLTNLYKPGFYYKPNESRNLYATLTRARIKGINNCSNDSFIENLYLQSQILQPRAKYTENAVGKTFFITFLLSSGYKTVYCRADMLNNVVLAELAIKNYKTQNGKLPNQLSDLFPNYLQELPADPYNRQTLHYNSQKQILYSVGQNGKDLGGSEGADWTQMENPTFKIGF